MNRPVALATVIFVCLLTSQAQAAPPEINFSPGFPNSPAVGKIEGKGTWALPQGWTAVQVTLVAAPVGGGLGSSTVGFPNMNGNWGPLTLQGLQSGVTYNVTAVLGARDQNNDPQVINSQSIQVIVR